MESTECQEGLGERSHRRILLTVSGLSPQVITETLYALTQKSGVAWTPTEIHALTTTEGARRIHQVLLAPGIDGREGGFWRLSKDYQLPEIAFDGAHVHLIRDPSGRPLDDIRSETDNALMANAMTELVRKFTSEPDTELHVSLAGGRKTMGYYAGYALSLFGRKQDRLSHVLVDQTFESIPQFCYPTPHSEMLPLRDGGFADAAHAAVNLALIPFVRLRALLPAEMLTTNADFATAVRAAESRVGPPKLVVDISNRCLVMDGQEIALTPWHFALMALLAWRCKRGLPPLHAPLRDTHDEAWATEAITQLRKALGVMHVPDAVETQLRTGATGNKLSPHWSRLRARLAEQLGKVRADLYFHDGGTHRNKRYRVPLGPEAIDFRYPTGAASLQKPRRD